MSTVLKNAIMITGAAARISQEVACIDKLIEKKGLEINQDDTLLTGFSSGSLNLLALNTCFRKNNPLDWNTFYKEQVLWTLDNDKVYTKNGFRIPIFDTKPLRGTLNAFLEAAQIEKCGDLPFSSYVLTFSEDHLRTEWAGNFGTVNQGELVASDLFMASTAIPIAFPSQTIADTGSGNRNFPNGHFADGGTGGQFKHFEDTIGAYVLANGPFDMLNIISPMREDAEAELKQLAEGIHGLSFSTLEKDELDKLAATLSFGGFLKFLQAIQAWQKINGPLAHEILVNIPWMETNFGILDFNQEEAQYNAVCQWIDANPNDFAVPLDQFVANHSTSS